MTLLAHVGREETASRSKFPFADAASLTADTGVVLPRQAFVDAAVYPPGSGPFKLGRVTVGIAETSFEIQDATDAYVAVGTASVTDPPAAIRLSALDGTAAGVLIPDRAGLSALAGWPRGRHLFRKRSAEFAAAVCLPSPSGVTGFLIGDETFSGDVMIVAERGVVLRTEEIEEDAFVIRLDVVGDPLYTRASCEPILQDAGEDGLVAKNYLRFLKIHAGESHVTLSPNDLGNVSLISASITPQEVDAENFDFAPRSALRIRSESGGLRFEMVGAPEKESR